MPESHRHCCLHLCNERSRQYTLFNTALSSKIRLTLSPAGNHERQAFDMTATEALKMNTASKMVARSVCCMKCLLHEVLAAEVLSASR